MDVFTIWTVFSSVVATASIIAKITPTPKDDAIVAKIKSFVDLVALNPKK